MRTFLGGIAVLAAAYAAIAYVLMPLLWAHHERQPGLAARPMTSRTAQGIPGDPLNVGLVGSKGEVVTAMSAAGWRPADPITLESSLRIGLSVALVLRYPDAPVSNLYYDGRKQDLAFEMDVGGSADRRHHVRLWRLLASGVERREVWLGSASFDTGVGFSRDTGQITHHIDPDVDAERDYFIKTLSSINTLEEIYKVTGVGPTLNGRNGGGDPYFTDGEVTIGVLDSKRLEQQPPGSAPASPTLHKEPTLGMRSYIWRPVAALARLLGLVPKDGRGKPS